MGVTDKYFGSQDTALHGGQLTWPGTMDGFPIHGAYHGDLKQEEYEDITYGATFRCETFFTWDPESMAKFQKVMDLVSNGQFFIKKRMEHYDEKNQGWRLYVEWDQVYGMAPRQNALTYVYGNRVGG